MNEELNIMQEAALIVKSCKKCGEVKPLEDFNKQSKMRDQRANVCKKCKSALNKKRYNDPEFDRAGYIEKQKGWNKENPKKLYRRKLLWNYKKHLLIY